MPINESVPINESGPINELPEHLGPIQYPDQPGWADQPDQADQVDPSEQVDLAALMGQVAQMQQGLAEAQASAAAQEVEGASGGGVVRVTATGAMEFRSVSIDPAAVDPGDVTMLEDLVLAAVHDVVAKVAELNRQVMGPLGMGGPGSPLGL